MSEDKAIYKKAGGNRPGAGRKKKGKPILFKPDLDLEPIIQGKSNKTAYINKCIREHEQRIEFRIEEAEAAL